MCIAVAVDEPNLRSGYYGGQIAAPIFKRIADRAANFLNIKPDVQPDKPNDLVASDKLPELSAVAQARAKP